MQHWEHGRAHEPPSDSYLKCNTLRASFWKRSSGLLLSINLFFLMKIQITNLDCKSLISNLIRTRNRKFSIESVYGYSIFIIVNLLKSREMINYLFPSIFSLLCLDFLFPSIWLLIRTKQNASRIRQRLMMILIAKVHFWETARIMVFEWQLSIIIRWSEKRRNDSSSKW